jgi:hypothetical protein
MQGGDYLEDPNVDERINIKMSCKEIWWVGWSGIGSFGPE